MDSMGGAMPFGGLTEAAQPLANAAPMPPVNPMTAAPTATPAAASAPFSLMPQSPEMASGLQNIAPALSKAMNGGQPVDAANPFGQNLMTGQALTERQNDQRSDMFKSLAQGSQVPPPPNPQMQMAKQSALQQPGQSLSTFLATLLASGKPGGLG